MNDKLKKVRGLNCIHWKCKNCNRENITYDSVVTDLEHEKDSCKECGTKFEIIPD